MERTAKCRNKILLVEDDKIDVMTIQRALTRLNLTESLLVVSNGEDALNYLRNDDNELPCMILLDLKMPRMGGLELLKAVKEDDELKIIPVIVLTTSNETEDRLESFKLNIAGYFVKPLDYFELSDVINSYWNTSELPCMERIHAGMSGGIH